MFFIKIKTVGFTYQQCQHFLKRACPQYTHAHTYTYTHTHTHHTYTHNVFGIGLYV